MISSLNDNPFDMDILKNSNSWPIQEAKKIIQRMNRLPKDKTIVFETGYGPSLRLQ